MCSQAEKFTETSLLHHRLAVWAAAPMLPQTLPPSRFSPSVVPDTIRIRRQLLAWTPFRSRCYHGRGNIKAATGGARDYHLKRPVDEPRG